MNKLIIAVTVAALASCGISVKAQLDVSGAGAQVVGSLAAPLIGVLPGSNAGNPNGTVSSWVISGASIDTSGLIFIYQVVNEGPDAIDNAEFTGFSASQVLSTGSYSSVTGLTLSGGLTPSSDGHFSGENTFGGTVTFENGNLNSGDTSEYLAVLTNVKAFSGNYGQIQDNFTAAGNILAPVPEANTIVAGALMLLPLGIGAVRALRKERSI